MLAPSSKTLFLQGFPASRNLQSVIGDSANTLLIYDKKLLSLSAEFRAWVKQFKNQYPVVSGEQLKDLHRFPLHAEKLAKLAENISPRDMSVVAVGGGSVGDFAGFFASIYKRGVRLVHVPSTWLAAIDSSHGGKTALNRSGVKNQFGTFYPADKVVLIRALLESQPRERVRDAMGELAKIALIDGGAWSKRVARTQLRENELLWEFLKPAIEAKLKVVARDPFEKTGHRQILNLGHTIGHVLEAAHGLSHGQAVAQGLLFALEYSRQRGLLSAKANNELITLLKAKFDIERAMLKPISRRRFSQLILQDKKKSSSDRVVFLFVRGQGRVFREHVSLSEIIEEAIRQGLVRSR